MTPRAAVTINVANPTDGPDGPASGALTTSSIITGPALHPPSHDIDTPPISITPAPTPVTVGPPFHNHYFVTTHSGDIGVPPTGPTTLAPLS